MTEGVVGLRILVVEGNEAVRGMLKASLDRAGCMVATAANSDLARQIVDSDMDGFDLLVTEAILPGRMQGPALSQVLREKTPGFPVLYLTGQPGTSSMLESETGQGDRWLMKPTSRVDLLAAIAETCFGHRKSRE